MKNMKNNKEVQQKKGKRVVMAILNTIINILIVLVLVISLLVAIMALTSKANNGLSQVFGYSFHTIQSPSMEGGSEDYEGGDYNIGDLVIGKVTNGDGKLEYNVGDIVVFTTEDKNIPLKAHRIIKRDLDESGQYVYTTKGDNNPVEDEEKQYAVHIIAVTYDKDYHGAVLKGVGNVLDFLSSSKGFFLAILLPMIAFFLYAVIRVVLNAVDYRKAKEKEIREDAEKEKQEAVEAAVKAALEAKGEAAPAAEASAPNEMSQEQMEQFKQFLAFQKMQNAAQDAPAQDAPAQDEAPAEESPAEEE